MLGTSAALRDPLLPPSLATCILLVWFLLFLKLGTGLCRENLRAHVTETQPPWADHELNLSSFSRKRNHQGS